MAVSLEVVEKSEFDSPLHVDPFGAMPEWASCVAGLGGPNPSADPTYVFRTVAVRPATGEVTVQIYFQDCVASDGVLLIDVAAISSGPGQVAARMRTIEVPLEQLVAADGVVDVLIDASRNAQYSIAGHLDGGKLEASAIRVNFDRRERPGEHGPGWRRRAEPIPMTSPDGAMISSWLAGLETPTLAFPRSQPFTERQCREPAYAGWAAALHRPDLPDPETWALAYVLQVLEQHSALSAGADGLGFLHGGQPLPAILAARECQVLVAEHLSPGEFAIDPAAALAPYRDPALCDDAIFSDLVHHAMFDYTRIAEPLRNSFDFTWSIGINRRFSLSAFMNFIHNSLNYLRPGGLAIHVFDFRYGQNENFPSMLSRVEVERIALLSMSHLCDVVRLLFRRSDDSAALIREQTLYGLILRRGGLAA